ncbi:MAG TPA: flagellar biosynthesis protein FliQ [Aquificaceae bacterium]|nr:flagellar biosynthesis protein FliQ [Aquificaceae bacterium]HIQ49458.1 flagellar biosynthesis protein FliQ [Aquifex aeolicus]
MEQDLIISLGQRALEMTLFLAMPVLLATFFVGLAVSIFQAATQIQEMTLAYIPKVLTAFLVIFLLGGWMLTKLVDFAKEIFANIPVWIK